MNSHHANPRPKCAQGPYMTDPKADEPLFGMTHTVVQTGVSAKTIVHYEDIRLLPPIRRNSNGDRLFTPTQIALIKQIRAAREERVGRVGKRRFHVTSTTTES
jgi:MerR-like DNA binding protein